jgi:hypothetical protein
LIELSLGELEPIACMKQVNIPNLKNFRNNEAHENLFMINRNIMFITKGNESAALGIKAGNWTGLYTVV